MLTAFRLMTTHSLSPTAWARIVAASYLGVVKHNQVLAYTYPRVGSCPLYILL